MSINNGTNAVKEPPRIAPGEAFPSGWFGDLHDWIKASQALPDNKTVFAFPTKNGKILSTNSKGGGSTGSPQSEYQGQFKIIDVSDDSGYKISVLNTDPNLPISAEQSSQFFINFNQLRISKTVAGGVNVSTPVTVGNRIVTYGDAKLENYAITDTININYIYLKANNSSGEIKVGNYTDYYNDTMLLPDSNYGFSYAHMIGRVSVISTTQKIEIVQYQYGAIQASVTYWIPYTG